MPSATARAVPRPRLLIFVIAYYAEKSLRQVLERVPDEVFSAYEAEILIVDDASQDRTFAIGREYRDAHPEIPVTVLRNEFNQGYGGNQKVGYQYAIRESFDFVAMVHGDGQYAPEELPRLLRPLREGTADAVFGSRMMTRFGALRGGMPLYKFVGNRILTTSQNILLRSKLSEFHSGYRIYRVRSLESIRFQLNSNNFHFDTEIILQLMNAKQRIVEMPIPTYYGDEISRVEGLKYAKNVMLATLQNLAHRSGVLYQRRFDPVDDGPANARYDLKLGFASSHQWALDAIPNGTKVLDMGAGPGGLAAKLVEKGCEVAVVDFYAPSTTSDGVKVFVQDLDEPLSVDVAGYQQILLLDVIEHLKSPEIFLERLRRQFDYVPRKLIVTTPNIAFVTQRLMLLFGQFNYGRVGILDQTHTRLFTFRTLEHLLRDAGFKISDMRGIPAPFPKVVGSGWLGRSLSQLNLLAIGLSKTLFSYQIFVVAESTPDTDFILSDTKARSRESSNESHRLPMSIVSSS